jgi:uncharacterized protein YndB with AHSA1/START domain
LQVERETHMEKIDAIEREITVKGSVDKVWRALTDAGQLAQWFGDSAEVDLKPGGAFRVGWSEYDSIVEGVIEVVDQPATFAYRWEAGTTADGTVWTTRVEFTLEEADGITTVKVVETGFSELPDELYGQCFKENASGWAAEMADLQRHLQAVAAP